MSQRARIRLLELATLALAALIALRALGFGDYPFDAGPALTAIAHGSVQGFFSHQPVMGPFALYLRAPFAAFAAAIGDGPLGLYRWGDLPWLVAVAGAAIGLARFARSRMPADARDGWPALLT